MILAIVGATATGKSALALAVARAVWEGGLPAYRGAEIVNADAMALYRGMDIGTAKVSNAEREEIAHHQIDVLDPADEASVAAYQREARADVAAIEGRGHLPIVVGGSGLYVRALLDEIDFPPTDPQVRARLTADVDRLGAPALHERLAGLDPHAAHNIAPTNARRVVRALEVIELTGRPFSATMPRRRYVRRALQVGCTQVAEELEERIRARTRSMWEAGLVDETMRVRAGGWGKTAAKAIGYAQAAAYADGKIGEEEAIEEITRRTLRLVRKQRLWFRSDPRVHWLAPEATAHDVLALVASAASGI
ncbi:MAG: tRNA (adenosine(37)-N6)-dimethylallyltransferase MiaA [Bowdeniella nasicola]|nr:tRNA (adenosine(37)-N6)-dimethylallyltransferase MiaA [Bowdeniella nasicola]